MVGELQLLNILLIILKVSNSGMIIHNNPAASYSSEFRSALDTNFTQFCSINVDEHPDAFKDIYKIERVVMFDFGLKINSLTDLPTKEHSDSYTEINVYKLDRIKCAEEPVDKSFEDPHKDLMVSLRHICLVNDTHFGVEAGYSLLTYPIEFFQQSLEKIDESYEDSENAKRYAQIVSVFGYEKCKRECVKEREINSSSHISLMHNCSRCHECEYYEKVEDKQSKPFYEVYWKLILYYLWIIAIYLLFIGFLYAKNIIITNHFWELRMSFLLKIPLFLAILGHLPETEYLHVCTLKEVCSSWDIVLISLTGLNYLKLDQLRINNFNFNKRLKIRTVPDLVFIVIFIVSASLISYYTFGENYLKPSEANQCETESFEWISKVQIILISLITCLLCSPDSTGKIVVKISVIASISINFVIVSRSVYDRLGLSFDSHLLPLFELSVATFQAILKHYIAPPVGKEQDAQTNGDAPIELNQRRSRRGVIVIEHATRGRILVINSRSRGYANPNQKISRYKRNRRRLERRRLKRFTDRKTLNSKAGQRLNGAIRRESFSRRIIKKRIRLARIDRKKMSLVDYRQLIVT